MENTVSNSANSANRKTSIRNFGHGVVVEICFDLDNLEAGFNVKWTGKPTRRIVDDYLSWVLGVHRQIADETGLRMIYTALMPGGNAVVWAIVPGEPPQPCLP